MVSIFSTVVTSSIFMTISIDLIISRCLRVSILSIFSVFSIVFFITGGFILPVFLKASFRNSYLFYSIYGYFRSHFRSAIVVFCIFLMYSIIAFICPISELFFVWLFLVLLLVNIFEYNEKRKKVNVKVKNVKRKFLTFWKLVAVTKST